MRLRMLAVSGALLLSVATPAQANMGIPMLVLLWPGLLLTLPLVVWIESISIGRSLRLGAGVVWRPVLAANLWSTAVGVPLVWLLLLGLQMLLGGGGASELESLPDRVYAVTLQAPWLVPHEGALHWLLPSAAAVLLLPMCAGSIWIEFGCLRERFPEAALFKAVLWGNLLSYAVLEALTLACFLFLSGPEA